jgi:hypothetical protein
MKKSSDWFTKLYAYVGGFVIIGLIYVGINLNVFFFYQKAVVTDNDGNYLYLEYVIKNDTFQTRSSSKEGLTLKKGNTAYLRVSSIHYSLDILDMNETKRRRKLRR